MRDPRDRFTVIPGDDARDRFSPGEPEDVVSNPPEGVRVIRAVDWADKSPPPRRWLVDGLVPTETVTLLTGEGGQGKSTLAVQLAVCRAVGKSWIGIPVKPGKTLILSAEDDADELHRRCDAICRQFAIDKADLGDLVCLDLVGSDAVLGELNPQRSKIIPSRLYAYVEALIATERPSLLILDALADMFAGNEIDRQHARQFIGLLKKLCRVYSLTVVLIAHPSLQGMQNGSGQSGSTAWSASVRSRLYFRRPDNSKEDTDLRVLQTKKSNYGPAGGQITLRYDAGAFVPLEGQTTDRAARDEKAQAKFLELLDWHTDCNINVSAKPSRSYAPAVFAVHQNNTDGFTKDDFTRAMQRHLGAKVIREVSDGPPSKQRSKLTRWGG